MELSHCIERLTAGAEAIRALIAGIPDDDAQWKPSPEQWSIVEIVSHLRDEERDDFRARLERTLRAPEEEWDPIDPEGWARDRDYAGESLQASLNEFLLERDRSIAWLGSLETPDWSRTHTHPRLGSLSAGDLMVSWLAHDLLHIRQITRLLWGRLGTPSFPFTTAYAGSW